jgi:hypothetical protein
MARDVKKSRPKTAGASNGRVRKLTKKQSKAKARKEVSKRRPLPSSFRLAGRSYTTIRNNWRVLGGIVLVYLLLNVIFASGISNVSSSFSSIKSDINGHGIGRALGGFLGLIGSSGASGSATGGTLQSILFVLESLVIIWALRHLLSDQKITVKQAWYNSMTPLIPFLLVILVIIIQLLPVTIGAVVLSVVSQSVFVNSGLASAVSIIALVLMAIWSAYMICSSIFAFYIVTLPQMQPRQALRSAKELVVFRRLLVLRKILFLPVVVLVVMAAIIVPLILWATWFVPYAFYILSMLAILFVHTYLYSLYRSLLDD